MCSWLADHGHNVMVVTTAPYYPGWKTFEGFSAYKFSVEKITQRSESKGSLTVRRCPCFIPKVPRGWRRVAYRASFVLSSTVVMLVHGSGWRPQIVLLIEPTLLCAPQAILLARLTRAATWLHVQDFEVDAAFQLEDFPSKGLSALVRRGEKWLLKKFDRVSTISRQMVGRLLEKGVSPEKTVLFPNWVDTSRIYPLSSPSSYRSELGISLSTIVALYSGSMGLKQGLDLLAQACRRLAYRTDIQFVFCGEGPYRQGLAGAIKGARNVRLLPIQPTSRLNDLLNLADIHLLPQLANAADLVMPSKLSGMMASGRPVVATAREGTEISTVLKGKGIVTTPGDVDAFARAILRLADEPQLRFQMGSEGRSYATAHFGLKEILGSIENLMLKCSESRGSVNTEPVPTQPSGD